MIPSIFSLFCVFYELDWWSAQPTEWLMFMTLRTCQSPWRQERALCCIKHDALNALLMTRVFAVHKERLNRICYQFDWRTSWYRVLRQGIEGICNLWWLSAIEQAIRIQMSSSEGEWSWYGLSSQYDCLPSNVSPPLFHDGLVMAPLLLEVVTVLFVFGTPIVVRRLLNSHGIFTFDLFWLARYSTSISSLAFNSNGTTLAIAVSYTYEQGQMGYIYRLFCFYLTSAPADQIFIRYVDDKEVRPKEKKN